MNKGYKRSHKSLIPNSLFLILFAVILYLTKSHGAWFGVLGALVFGTVLKKVSANIRVIVIIMVIVFGTLTPFAAVRYWPNLQAAFHISERSSAASRMMIWRSAIDIGKDNAVFGIGPGNFQSQYLAYQKNYPAYLEWAVPQPHNTYLAFWLETGILGLAGFLCLLWWFFKKALDNCFELRNAPGCHPRAWPGDPSPLFFEKILDSRLRGNDRKKSFVIQSNWILDIRYLVFVIMFYILLHGAIDTLYWKNDLSVMFWALLAIASLQPPHYNNRQQQR